MTRAEIDSIVCSIMRNDGPDRHTDGHDVLTDFIVAAIEGRGEAWRSAYQSVGLDNGYQPDADPFEPTRRERLVAAGLNVTT
jgi:hypothetical protein